MTEWGGRGLFEWGQVNRRVAMAKRNEVKTIENAFLGEDLEIRFITLEGVLSRMEARVQAASIASKGQRGIRDLERRIRDLESLVSVGSNTKDARNLLERVNNIEDALVRSAHELGRLIPEDYDPYY